MYSTSSFSIEYCSLQYTFILLYSFACVSLTDWGFKVDGLLHNSSQEEVYSRCSTDIVARLMEGYNGTIMAYGQTGAGKTYTMSGPDKIYTMTGPVESKQLRGVIPRAINQVFREVRRQREATITVR